MNICDRIQVYLDLGLGPISLKPRSEEPLVASADHRNQRPEEQERRPSHCDFNQCVCSEPYQVILHFNLIEAFHVCSIDPKYLGQEVDHG